MTILKAILSLFPLIFGWVFGRTRVKLEDVNDYREARERMDEVRPVDPGTARRWLRRRGER